MDHRIAALERWDTGAEITPENYARLRADPRYPQAVRRFAANMLAESDRDPLLDGILKDVGRNVAAVCAAYLHLSGGLTLPRLKALCAGFGTLSAGRARALLIYLRYLKYVEAAGGPAKPALYVATPCFLDTWRRHQRAVLDATAVADPAAGALLEIFDRPGVFEAFVRHQCEVFFEASQKHDLNTPYYRTFMHRYGGIQIAHTLLVASAGDTFPPQHPIPFVISAVARRFKVSRIHVRRLIESGEREGLLKRCGDGALAFTTEGREAIDWVFATQLIFFLAAAGRALKEVQACAMPESCAAE